MHVSIFKKHCSSEVLGTISFHFVNVNGPFFLLLVVNLLSFDPVKGNTGGVPGYLVHLAKPDLLVNLA